MIQGITRKGRIFRSNDWAERLQGCMANYAFQGSEQLKNCMLTTGIERRRSFSPYLQIGFRNGIKSLLIKKELWETNADGYEFLINFARDNDLNLIEEQTEEALF
ncbi:conserved hypothetical protein [Gammaproteobacteria bacterium]